MFKFYAGASALLVLALAAVEASIGGRIYNGQDAAIGQIPYQAFLRITKAGTNKKGDCGGSVLSNRWVVTAAHCTRDQDSVEVILGVVDNKDPNAFITYSEEVHRHPDYTTASKGYDIALVKTTDEIPFSDVISPINLPSADGADPTVYDDTTGLISGWGRTFTVHRGVTRYLQYADTHIMNHDDCSEWYHHLLDAMVCTDNTTYATGTCSGDSGGPLASTGDDLYLIGLVSYAQRPVGQEEECGGNPQPKIYTNVASYLDWIAETTGTTESSTASSSEYWTESTE